MREQRRTSRQNQQNNKDLVNEPTIGYTQGFIVVDFDMECAFLFH